MDIPAMPPPPSTRVCYEGMFGPLYFQSMEEFKTWKAEPPWRRVLGMTAYDRRLGQCRG